MNRTIWFAAGAASSLYLVTKARRAADVLTPDGLEDRLAGLAVGVGLFRDEVATAMAAKESELRERLTGQRALDRPKANLDGHEADLDGHEGHLDGHEGHLNEAGEAAHGHR